MHLGQMEQPERAFGMDGRAHLESFAEPLIVSPGRYLLALRDRGLDNLRSRGSFVIFAVS